VRASTGKAIGVQNSLAGERIENPGGITPTTVTASPPSVMPRPTMAGSALKRRRQSRSERTTTASPPGRSSLSRNVRPSAGIAPSIGKRLALTAWPCSSSGSPAAVSVAVLVAIAAICENVRLRSCQRRKLAGDTTLAGLSLSRRRSQMTARRSDCR